MFNESTDTLQGGLTDAEKRANVLRLAFGGDLERFDELCRVIRDEIPEGSEGGPMFRRSPYIALSIAAMWLYAGCSDTPVTPSRAPAQENAAAQPMDAAMHAGHLSPNANEDKGYIKGWFEGEDVQLYYTKSYFCDALSPAATVPCEVGAPPDDAPRRGPIPTIYAIVATPLIVNLVNPDTLACGAGTACLNHPLMIDLSRIGGSPTAGPAAHNHILSARGGGWFHTVNIRVFSVDAWNAIAAAKSLAAVRALQGDPAVGRPGVISADTPTNIYFFIASWR
jgi:hypothetical protein